MRDIGANIRRARVRRKLTQDDLAQTVHTTRQTISNYETGRSRPDVETLQRLADALSVELTELLDGAPSADARRAALRRVCIMGTVTLILAGLWAYLHAVCLRQYQRGGMAPLAAMLITEPLLLCALASLLFGCLSADYASKAATGFARNLRHDMYYRVQDFSFSNIDKFSTASIVTRLTSDVATLQNTFQMMIRIAIRCPMMLILALFSAMRISVKLSLVYCVALPLLALVLIGLIPVVFKIFDKVFKTYDSLNNVVQEELRPGGSGD